jgi:hypothetical protein
MLKFWPVYAQNKTIGLLAPDLPGCMVTDRAAPGDTCPGYFTARTTLEVQEADARTQKGMPTVGHSLSPALFHPDSSAFSLTAVWFSLKSDNAGLIFAPKQRHNGCGVR